MGAETVDFSAILGTDDGKAAFIEAAKNAGFIPKDDLSKHVEAQIMARTEGLGIDGAIKKKKELEAKIADPELKAAKEAKRQLDAILAKTGANGYNDLETFFDKILHPEEPDDVRELRRNYTKTKDELTRITEERKQLEESRQKDLAFIEKTLKADRLRAGLMDMGCNKIQADALSLYLMGKAQFEIIDTERGREAVVKDSGLTVDEYLNQWAQTEEARQVLPAKITTGGNATGSGSVKGRTPTIEEIAKMDLTPSQRVELYKKTGKV